MNTLEDWAAVLNNPISSELQCAMALGKVNQLCSNTTMWHMFLQRELYHLVSPARHSVHDMVIHYMTVKWLEERGCHIPVLFTEVAVALNKVLPKHRKQVWEAVDKQWRTGGMSEKDAKAAQLKAIAELVCTKAEDPKRIVLDEWIRVIRVAEKFIDVAKAYWTIKAEFLWTGYYSSWEAFKSNMTRVTPEYAEKLVRCYEVYKQLDGLNPPPYIKVLTVLCGVPPEYRRSAWHHAYMATTIEKRSVSKLISTYIEHIKHYADLYQIKLVEVNDGDLLKSTIQASDLLTKKLRAFESPDVFHEELEQLHETLHAAIDKIHAAAKKVWLEKKIEDLESQLIRHKQDLEKLN